MKKNRKKLIIICCISVLLIVVLALATSYALFRLNVTKDTNFKVKAGFLELSIDDSNLGNVIEDGKIIVNNLEPMKENTALTRDGYNFKLKNTGSIDSGYTIYLDSIVLESETKERLDNSLIKVNLTNNTTNESHTYSFNGLIDGILEEGTLDVNEENSYTLRIWLDYSADNSAQDKYFAVQIRVDGTQKNYRKVLTFKQTILRNNTLETAPLTNNDNGLYSLNVTNGFGGSNGTSYFFRGNVTNNYVSFAGMTWRIVRINEDGTVRLILEDGINDSSEEYVFGTDDSYMDAYYTNRNDYIKKTVEDWYSESITGTDASKVATGNYFCEAAKVKYYEDGLNNAEMVLYSNYTPDLVCNTDANNKGLVNASVGLITYDEASLAGVNSDSINYYLYKGYIWWTMSPESNAGSTPFVWLVESYGGLYSTFTDANNAVRPVINLKADVTVTGTGTISDPYVVE